MKNERLRIAGKLGPSSRLGKWSPVSILEMKGFLGIIINMGIINLPEISDYWKLSWESNIPFFSRVMPRNRFQDIFYGLHVSHSEAITVTKLDKLKMFLTKLVPKFRQHYSPSRHISIDETMIGFRGRFGSRQYMPQKPTKWGIKAFTMADSANGYLLDTIIYTGADTLGNENSYSTFPKPAQVVLHLARPYLNKGYHIVTDRYYSSVPLTLELEKNLSYTATIVKNRIDLPDPIRDKGFKLKSGEFKAYRCENVLVTAWRPEKN